MSEYVVSVRLKADGSGLVGEVRLSADALKDLAAQTGKAAAESGKTTAATRQLTEAQNAATAATKRGSSAWIDYMKGLAGYDVLLSAGRAALNYAQSTMMLAARHEELGIVMAVVGRNAGYNAAQMAGYASQVQAMGITMIASRNTVVQLAQAEIDLSHASQLARAAQDAAVIGMTNSSDALQRMIYGIKSGQTDVLRTLGINVNFEQSYKRLAAQLGTTTEALSEQQKMQARMRAVLEETEKLTGTYEAAMGTAAKQMRSMTRYTEDLKTITGEVFNEALIVAVMGFADQLKGANKELDDLSQHGELKEWGRDLADTLAEVADFALNTGRALVLLVQGAVVSWKSIKALSTEMASRPMPQAGSVGFVAGLLGLTSGISTEVAAEREMALSELDTWVAKVNTTLEKLGTGSSTVFADMLAKRRAVQKEEDAALIAAQEEFVAKSLAVQRAYANSSVKIQAAAQMALAKRIFPREFPDRPKTDTETTTAKISEYARLTQSIREKIAVSQLELQTEGKLTEGEKLAMKVRVALRDGTLKATDAQQIYLAGLLEELITGEKVAVAREAETKAREETLKVIDKMNQQARATIDAARKEAESIEEQAAAYGLSKGALIGLQIAKLQDRALYYSQFEDGAQMVGWINREIEARRELLLLLNSSDAAEAYKKNADAQIAEQKRASNEIERLLGDGIMRGFERGESIGETFWTTMVNLAKTQVLRPVISFVVSPISGAISAALTGMGISGAANATGGVGGAPMGVGGWLSAGQSAYSAMTGGFSSAYTSFATSGVGQYMGLGTQALAPVYEGGALVSAGSGGLTGLGSTVGTGLGYAGAGLAGIAMGSAIAGDKQIVGLDGTTIAAIGAAVGSIWGPLGTFVGGVVGGVADAAFGMGPKQQSGDTRLAGSFSGTGFAGGSATDWKQEGGWFRSDKSGTDVTALAQTQYDAYAAMMTGTASVFGKLTTVAGEGTRSLDGWSFAVDRVVQTQEQEEQLMIDIAESMAGVLIPELATFKIAGENLADTAVRMTDEFILTSELADLLGKDAASAFGAVGLASLGARDNMVALMGGLQNLTTVTQKYYQEYFTDVERQANDLQSVGEQFKSLGLSLPASRDELRLWIEQQDLSTEAGRTMAASLMGLSGGFAAVTQSTDQTAAAAKELARTNQSWQDQLDVLSGARTKRQVDLQNPLAAATDATTKALIEQLFAQQDLADATQMQQDFLYALLTPEQQYAKDIADMTAAYAAVNLAVPTSTAELIALVESLELTTQAGQDAMRVINDYGKAITTTLVPSAPSMLQPGNAVGTYGSPEWVAEQARRQAEAEAEAARKLAAYTSQNNNLQAQLLELQGKSTEALALRRQMELDAINTNKDLTEAQKASLSATQQAIYALQDQAEAARKLAAYTSQSNNAQVQLLELQGKSTEALALRRQMELDAINTNKDLTEAQKASLIAQNQQIWALEDQQKAAEAAAQAAAAAKQAAEEQQRAAEALKNAWQSATDSIMDEVARIRGMMGTGPQSLAYAQAQFAIATGQARAGDIEAAQRLPELSRSMLDLAAQTAASSTDLRRLQGQTLTSLETTAGYAAARHGVTPTGDPELLAEIKALRAAVEKLQKSSDQTAVNTKKTADVLDDTTGGGGPMLVKTT